MVEALRHETLPRTLHVDEPTPHVDWTAGDVRAADRGTALADRRAAAPRRRCRRSGCQRHQRPRHPGGGAGRRAGLAWPSRPSRRPSAGELPWLISAAQRRRAAGPGARLAAHLDGPGAGTEPADVAHSLRTARSALRAPRGRPRRRGTGPASPRLAARRRHRRHRVVTGTRRRRRPRWSSCSPARAPSGPAWPPTCSTPRRSSPSRIAACADALAPHVDWSLRRRARGADGRPAARPGRRGAAGALGRDGVAGRAVAQLGVDPDGGDRPFPG